MSSTDKAITIIPYESSQETEWRAFLKASCNGTLFHDLDFLAYHPRGRFNEHHLLFYQAEKLCALFPAALVDEPGGKCILKSPYGASVGGFALPADLRLLDPIDLLESLKDYVTTRGINGIEIRMGPNIYSPQSYDTVGFALAASGFSLSNRWLTPIIPLPPDPAEVLNVISNKRRRSYVRAALRKGLQVIRVDQDYLPQFYPVLENNRAKKGAQPTHTLDELQRILELVPDRVHLFVCIWESQVVAGTVMFDLTDELSYSFCPAHDEKFEALRPAAFLLAKIAEHYVSRGYRYLDLGPTGGIDVLTNSLTFNRGGARFKEEMGGIGFCRDTWRWMAK